MRRPLWLALVLVTFAVSTPGAQEALSSKQRIADLEQLAALYAKNYAPYEWKRDVIGFDLLRLTPWLQRIHHSDDLDFQEALIEYVASLNDAHDVIAFPTTFFATLGFTVDIYDGRVLIEIDPRTGAVLRTTGQARAARYDGSGGVVLVHPDLSVAWLDAIGR